MRVANFLSLVVAVYISHGLPSRADDLSEVVRRQAEQIAILEARVRLLEAHLTTAVPAASLRSGASAPELPTQHAPEHALSQLPGDERAFERSRPKLRGRAMFDAWGTASDTRAVDYPSGSDVRIAVLGVEGRLNDRITYRMEADLASEPVALRDAWLRFKGMGPIVFTAGNVKPLFSLEHLSGLRHFTFLEAALPNVFAINESLGVQVERQQSRWYAGFGVFGEPAGVSLPGDEGLGIAARFVHVPVLDERSFVHLGVSAYHKALDADAGASFRLRQRPEIRLFGTRLADTGEADAESSDALALEFGAALGSLSLQGEYLANRVAYRFGGASFDGAYVFGSWLVTGETRRYNPADSTIGRVRPRRAFGNGGWGAFELALRFSTLDLIDAGIHGGSEENVTFGLNWYLTEYARLMANYVHYEVHDSFAVRPLGSPAHRGDALGIRAQMDW